MTALLWFRQNLRLHDNPPLAEAVHEHPDGVLPLYLLDTSSQVRERGGASKWALHQVLSNLNTSLEARYGQSLYVEKSNDIAQRLVEIAKQVGASAIYTEQRWEPGAADLEDTLEHLLAEQGIAFKRSNASLLNTAAHEGCKANGEPYQVFSHFWKNQLLTLQDRLRQPLPAPDTWPSIHGLDDTYTRCDLDALALMPNIHWYGQMAETWDLSEAGAQKRFQTFLDAAVNDYKEMRNMPGIPGTSMMSPYLHFGVVSVVELAQQSFARLEHTQDKTARSGLNHYISELGWREFAHHLIAHFPETTHKPLKDQYASFPWKEDTALLKAWEKGQTGYPIIDAGMRELYATGWMHNRTRMIVGSLLVKHMLQPWQAGEAWFWDTLIDADVASNTMGWQWIAGCGADAAPYFRIFNPIMQSEKFDGQGAYIRRWVPELKDVPNTHIHTPWEMTPLQQEMYKVKIGSDYPVPIIDHKEGRERALAAFQELKAQG